MIPPLFPAKKNQQKIESSFFQVDINLLTVSDIIN